jgi:RNA polymerase I-specific transcription initiation factor RRN6
MSNDTSLGLIGYMSFSEDVDEAASTLRELMDALSLDTEAAGTVTVTPLAIRPSPFIQSDAAAAPVKAMPDLSDVYDKLVALWVSCLPRRIPGPARLAKEKLIRSVATELCLSSMGVFIRDKSVVLPKPAEIQEGTDFVLPVRTKPDLSEKEERKSIQTSSAVPVSSLLTPAATPSLPSSDSTTPFGESVEDGAILRLRGYTLFIKSQPPLGASRSAILAHWPSSPGVHPSKYSWEASRKAVAKDEDIDSAEDEALIRQQEQDRRRRRTERFLKRQRVNTIDAGSQPLPAPAFGSQPDPAQHPVSSQSADVPMTQPDRGAFGSRLGPKGFKKRRTMGF